MTPALTHLGVTRPLLLTLLLTTLWALLTACQAKEPANKPALTGVSMTGIDHLADHLSVQDFWVNGRSGFQAGKGGRTVCCGTVPKRWYPGAQIEVSWAVANWQAGTWHCFRRQVPLDRYDELGQLYVHFMPDGTVRALLSNYYPEGNAYPGPRIPIPSKKPWDVYPPPPTVEHCPENEGPHP
jgi:hypothetical protein